MLLNSLQEYFSQESSTFNVFIIILGIVGTSLMLAKAARLYSGRIVQKLLSRRGVNLSQTHRDHFTFPLGLMTFAGFSSVGIELFNFRGSTPEHFLYLGRILLTIGQVLVIYQTTNILFLYLAHKISQDPRPHKLDKMLLSWIRKTVKFFIIAIGAVIIGEVLTLDMKGLIAGLGIGGIAIALASKDTISNLLGSLTVVLDRPFKIGDWVKINNKIEGIVKEVGLRSCRIRTFYDSLVVIPNGELANAEIDNFGSRNYRRLSTHISVEYSTSPEQIEAFCAGIRQLIKGHPHTRKDEYYVYLNHLGDSGLEIMLYVFWKVPNWSMELAERHRLLIDILRLGHGLNINFAFPTQTLHMFSHQPPKTLLDAPSPIIKRGP